MKKILVPVDFSGHTEATCNYALEFARTSGAEILLFHTYFDQIILADSSFPDAIDMSTMYNEELLKEVFHQSEKNIADLKQRLERKVERDHIQGISIRTSLSGGEIEPELRQVCNEFNPDIVIMGSTGKGKTMNIWGKVSTFIIDHAKVPVFIIPESSKCKSFRNIMLATDLSGNEEKSLITLTKTFQGQPIRIFCTHFLQKSAEAEDHAAKMDEMKLRIRDILAPEMVTFHLVDVHDDNQAAINQFIHDQKIDLIAFQPHKHGLFYLLFTKKITKKNLLATNIPVLAVPV